jgi:4-aminobutyrate aminotransferase-like enzyme
MQWGHPTLSQPKKLNQQTSASKGMMLFDIEGPEFLDFKSCLDVVNSNLLLYSPKAA